MVNSNRENGFSEEEVIKIGKYAQKMTLGLTAIRDFGKDGNSAHMQEASMAKIEEMNRVISEIHREVDEERRAYLAKRREESRHEYTANEAAARFKFRDGSGEGPKAKLDEETQNIMKNKKMMEDIFSGKGVNVEILEMEKKEALKEQKKMRGRSGSVTAGIGGTLDLEALERHLAIVAAQGLGRGGGEIAGKGQGGIVEWGMRWGAGRGGGGRREGRGEQGGGEGEDGGGRSSPGPDCRPGGPG